jgi:hypothetical protein
MDFAVKAHQIFVDNSNRCAASKKTSFGVVDLSFKL